MDDATTPPVGEDGGDDTTWWPWLLAILAVVGIAAAIIAARRSGKGPSWSERAGGAVDQAQQMSVHLAALTPDAARTVAATDSPTLAALGVTLQQLVSSAPNETSRAAVEQVRASTAALHAAVDAVALSPTTPTSVDVDQLTALATRLHTAASSANALIASTTR